MFHPRSILLIAVPLALWAQDPTGRSASPVSPPAVSAGRAQFAQTCGFCHGRDARGASGPDLIRSTLVNHDNNGDLIGPVVHNGRPAKGMPAFQLSDQQIQNIAAFLHAEASVAANVARQMPTEYPVDKLLTGDAKRGAQYFEAHCTSCHSLTGNLAHVASRYKPFDLQTRIAFPSGAKNRVSVKEPNGATIQGDELYSDEFYITLRDQNGATHSYARNGSASLTVVNPLAEHERLLKTYSDADLHDLFAFLESVK